MKEYLHGECSEIYKYELPDHYAGYHYITLVQVNQAPGTMMRTYNLNSISTESITLLFSLSRQTAKTQNV